MKSVPLYRGRYIQMSTGATLDDTPQIAILPYHSSFSTLPEESNITGVGCRGDSMTPARTARSRLPDVILPLHIQMRRSGRMKSLAARSLPKGSFQTLSSPLTYSGLLVMTTSLSGWETCHLTFLGRASKGSSRPSYHYIYQAYLQESISISFSTHFNRTSSI